MKIHLLSEKSLGRWPLLAQTKGSYWRTREEYLGTNFPLQELPTAYPRLSQLSLQYGAFHLFMAASFPALSTLTLQLPSSPNDVAFNNAVLFINNLPVLQNLTLTGGSYQLLALGRADSPIEILDVAHCDKALRIAHLHCPKLREVHMSGAADVYGAGMWIISPGDTLLSRTRHTLNRQLHLSEVTDADRDVAASWRPTMTSKRTEGQCLRVDGLPAGYRWGYPVNSMLWGPESQTSHTNMVDVPGACLICNHDRWSG